ncbi:hypothetical protein CAOG_07018 [Capsaspora owczarzaki ATCC 30864]|uniref:hypothetical protein n=1 Tax=Capsaspora owczarzaki (strain ATCC 30864) TaxID=595528 RepID=UPI0001FE462A|nr:hypothetical protein CAOG_07018 [Capsaspora owczarzaki ATCC 30864]|eukprot:XP_004343742.1 hypothetical protein CAOG_07018 [Capsaspora owczarzaki ATCC 30864]
MQPSKEFVSAATLLGKRTHEQVEETDKAIDAAAAAAAAAQEHENGAASSETAAMDCEPTSASRHHDDDADDDEHPEDEAELSEETAAAAAAAVAATTSEQEEAESSSAKSAGKIRNNMNAKLHAQNTRSLPSSRKPPLSKLSKTRDDIAKARLLLANSHSGEATQFDPSALAVDGDVVWDGESDPSAHDDQEQEEDQEQVQDQGQEGAAPGKTGAQDDYNEAEQKDNEDEEDLSLDEDAIRAGLSALTDESTTTELVAQAIAKRCSEAVARLPFQTAALHFSASDLREHVRVHAMQFLSLNEVETELIRLAQVGKLGLLPIDTEGATGTTCVRIFWPLDPNAWIKQLPSTPSSSQPLGMVLAPPTLARKTSKPFGLSAEQIAGAKQRKEHIKQSSSQEHVVVPAPAAKPVHEPAQQILELPSDDAPVEAWTKAQAEIVARLATKQELLRKLRLVKHYRETNNLDELQTLIDKWLEKTQTALIEMQKEMPASESLGSLIQQLQLPAAVVGYDVDDEDFVQK